MCEKYRIIILVLIILFFNNIPQANGGIFENLNIDKDEFKGSVLGLGAIISTSPYIEVDNDVWPVPIIVTKYKNFFIQGNVFGYVLSKSNNLEFSLIGKPRFMGYESDDSNSLNGMEDRDWSLDGGIRIKWNNDLFTMSVSTVADLLNRHQGQEAEVLFSKKFKEGLFEPRIGVKWLSEEIVDYYYGVLGSEVRSGRPDYEGEPVFNFIAGVRVGLPLGEKWSIFGDVSYEDLSSKIEDSPIVDENSLFTYILGVGYKF